MTVNRFPEFVGEAECAKLTSALARIARALVDRHAGFLFGAGMSAPAPSNVPTGKSLASKLLSRFFENRSVSPEQLQHLAETVPFECIAQAVENLPGKKRADLTAYLTELMFESDPPINESHKKFLSVYNWGGEPRLRRIYTTNFDKLLEKAFAVRGVTVTERNANEIDTIEAQDRVPVLHLHGVLDEEYQITETDLFSSQFPKLHKRFETALREADAFTFVGYSMTDPDFRNVYMCYRDDIKSRREENKDSYVVNPVKNLEDYVLGKSIWEGRGAVWLPLDAKSFFMALRDILESKTTQEIEKAIMKKYRLADETAYREKIAQTAAILEINDEEAIQFLYETRPTTG